MSQPDDANLDGATPGEIPRDASAEDVSHSDDPPPSGVGPQPAPKSAADALAAPEAGPAGSPARSEPSPDPQPTRSPLPLALAGLGCLAIGLLLGRATSPHAPAPTPSAAEQPTAWTCSMHPQIQSPRAGTCPICAMDLIPVRAGGERGPRTLRLSPEAAALAELETLPVQRRAVAREVRLVGKVDYDETRLNYITAWVPGRLDRLYVDYTGTLVRKDDHLVELYSPELLTAQEELLQAIQARQALRGSESELLRSSSEATVASARKKLRLWGLGIDQIDAIERSGQATDRLTIRAPVGGVVVHKNKNTGDYVQTGERLYTIADLSRVWIKLDVYESDLAWVRYGQDVELEAEAYPGEPFAGRIVFVQPVLTGHTRTVKVRINVENAQGRLKPGMFVRATLRSPVGDMGQALDPALGERWICPMHWDVIREEPGACSECGMPLVKARTLLAAREAAREAPLVVPKGAVLWTGTRSLVYVREPGEEPVFRGQEVVLGPRAGDVYVVREGLKEGELVVTRGAFKLDSALQIEARPSMMLPPPRPATPVRHEVPAAFRSALDPLYAGYLQVQVALAADDLPGAQRAAEALSEALASHGVEPPEGARPAWLRLKKALRDASAALASGKDAAAARQAFQPLSQAALELERGFGHREGVLREAYCPMAFDDAGASWLQREGVLANPYFGARMLRCGELRETFPAREGQQ